MDVAELLRAFPPLRAAPPEVVREVLDRGRPVSLPAGAAVFGRGDRCPGVALLTAGSVRVFRVSDTGREVTLYRVGPGESCVLTTHCVLGDAPFPAVARVESDGAAALALPADSFRSLFDRHPFWRAYVFELMAARLAEIMEVLDEVVFRRLDQRVARLLVERGRQDGSVGLTHAEIAAELGSSREVVSRVLADLASRDLVRPTRGRIHLTDPDALRLLASS